MQANFVGYWVFHKNHKIEQSFYLQYQNQTDVLVSMHYNQQSRWSDCILDYYKLYVLASAMLQAVTCSFRATKSNEWTTFGTDLAILASPHPKSATTRTLPLPNQQSKTHQTQNNNLHHGSKTNPCSILAVLWHCWLGGRNGIRPVENWVVGCWRGYLSGARCRVAYDPANATTTHCFTFLVAAHFGSPGQTAVKCVCVLSDNNVT